MREFVDSTALLGDRGALLARLDRDSHLFFRRLLDPEAVLEVRRAVVGVLDGLGWLAGGTDPLDAVAGPGATGEGSNPAPAFFEAYERVQRLQVFHELAHRRPLVDLAAGLVGGEVLVHPRKIFRVSPGDRPDYVTPPHQDFPLVQGAVDTLTAWIALGDCPDDLGGLRVLAGSHAAGFRATHPSEATGGLALQAADDDPAWTSIDFVAGDVLVFHSLTVHGAKPNRTGRLRLSADFRYQALSDPVTPQSLGPHYHPPLPGYDELTEGWTSTASVAVPDGVRVVDPVDPSAATRRPPRPQLVSVRAG